MILKDKNEGEGQVFYGMAKKYYIFDFCPYAKKSFKILHAIDAIGGKLMCRVFYDLSKIALPFPPGHFFIPILNYFASNYTKK